MEELLHEYSSFDINDALNRIESQLEYGYLVVGGAGDDVEMAVIKTAIKLFREKYSNEKEID